MILDRIDSPMDVRLLPRTDLEPLAVEIRDALVATSARNGGHLAPNLGVVELTIALHRVLDLPRDTIVWDVSHQTYVHKLLTGRRERVITRICHGNALDLPISGRKASLKACCRGRQRAVAGDRKHGSSPRRG